MSYPGPALFEVEQLQQYQLMLAEMIALVNPDLKTTLQAEMLMVEKQINTRLANFRQRPTAHQILNK